jgi:hypothetical protein
VTFPESVSAGGSTRPSPSSCRVVQHRSRLRSGDRFWGQVRGPWGWFSAAQGEVPPVQQPGELQEKPAIKHGSGAVRILHGKEGVDGSSPSEGSFPTEEPPANGRFFVAAIDTVEHLPIGEGVRSHDSVAPDQNACKRGKSERELVERSSWGQVSGTDSIYCAARSGNSGLPRERARLSAGPTVSAILASAANRRTRACSREARWHGRRPRGVRRASFDRLRAGS